MDEVHPGVDPVSTLKTGLAGYVTRVKWESERALMLESGPLRRVEPRIHPSLGDR